MRYKCLVLDHDDTVVRSAETVNYPHFRKVLRELRPGRDQSLRDYLVLSADPGYHEMCRSVFGFTDEQMDYMYQDWKRYVADHVPAPVPGMGELLRRHRDQGGLLCVSSHSAAQTINRTWEAVFGLVPDRIYDWELGEGRRKPAPYALEDIMDRYSLSPRDLVVIDDLQPGAVMARSCGVDFIAAGWSHPYPELRSIMEANCDHYFTSIPELEKFLFA